MALSERDRVQIRKYLGFSRAYSQIFTELESAITMVQAQADGGSLPNAEGIPSPTELEIKTTLGSLNDLNDSMLAQWQLVSTTRAEDVTLDASRGLAELRRIGRSYVTQLSILLNIRPRADVFSPTSPRPEGELRRDPSDGY